MKITSIVGVLSLVLATVLAANADGKEYGKKLTVGKATKISEIIAHPEKYDGKRVRVEGAVVDVCQKRGCWIKIASDKEFESIRLKVEDGVIVFPMEAKGLDVVAEGLVSVKKTSVEDQIAAGKHLAEEQGTKFDPSTIKEEKIVVQINGDGAVIK